VRLGVAIRGLHDEEIPSSWDVWTRKPTRSRYRHLAYCESRSFLYSKSDCESRTNHSHHLLQEGVCLEGLERV
jgi:hypothetical protein